jgi:hypothetical protein
MSHPDIMTKPFTIRAIRAPLTQIDQGSMAIASSWGRATTAMG